MEEQVLAGHVEGPTQPCGYVELKKTISSQINPNSKKFTLIGIYFGVIFTLLTWCSLELFC